MGYTNNLYVIAAICGNFWQESWVNPGVWENLTVGDPGYGLGQWTDNPPIVMRRTALFDWLTANGYSHDSGDGQLNFLIYENIWVPTSFQQSAYNTLTEFIQSTSTNLADLTLEWMYHWEGINDGSYNNRYQYAQRFLTVMQTDNGVRLPWFSANRSLSISEADWNVLRIKDFFYTEEPPEPYEPTEEEIIAIFRKLLKKRGTEGVHIII